MICRPIFMGFSFRFPTPSYLSTIFTALQRKLQRWRVKSSAPPFAAIHFVAQGVDVPPFVAAQFGIYTIRFKELFQIFNAAAGGVDVAGPILAPVGCQDAEGLIVVAQEFAGGAMGLIGAHAQRPQKILP